MIKAISHLVIASKNVNIQTKFFRTIFQIEPHFHNNEFSDFVLPDKRRIAFFVPTGKTKDYFKVLDDSSQVSIGLTVEDIDLVYKMVLDNKNEFNLETSGPPKDHPWGEKSFLLIDSDKNRWEITQSPSEEGHLINKEM